ncbi:hypothetical protein MNEG_9051 [Monoraphidium neglectum]|uniref:Uncharacterized protein n=1 Tax=Monoraphidium neglectum TaxID=145388 RepID=A0A0D2MDS9_9CHLO|nr:hypothetical protein MNEG_9051 [Monoraphidium neglectum]KIY98911.1 hypothetical protein MNEG_9051 [Monoraphidium neglectum]|eukprot:XP_013897931.1 hypothetical protein MNEG_9051 [Monoraphidium neglectum]
MPQISSLAAFAAVALFAAGAAAGDFNFFPVIPPSVVTNCTTGDCAFPTAFSSVNQTAYPDLGNQAGSGLLTIAIADYYPLEPRFYFTPGAWCDMASVNVSLDTIAASAPVTAVTRRRLGVRTVLQAAAAGPSDVNITTACHLLQVTYRIGVSGVSRNAAPLTGGLYGIHLGTDLPEGLTCIEVKAAYSTSAFATTPDYTTLGVPALAASTVFSKQVCVFKMTRQASAVLKFDMCTTDTFTVNISSASPLPVNITFNGAPVAEGANLLRPLVKVWGSKVTELDGTDASVALDGSATPEANYITRYFPLASSYAGETLSYPLSELLQEGFYNISASVSLLTAYPLLTDLVGLNMIQQTDEPGVSAGVSGLYEAATLMVHDGALVGVQKSSTLTTLSQISSPSHSSGQAIAAGDNIVLSWQFAGAGSAVCTHDGAVVSNSLGNKCVSPLTVTARAFGSASSKHTVEVTFMDVCGRERVAEFDYTAKGLTVVTQPEVLNTDGTVKIILNTSRTTGAAASVRTPGTLAAALVSFALTLLAHL